SRQTSFLSAELVACGNTRSRSRDKLPRRVAQDRVAALDKLDPSRLICLEGRVGARSNSSAIQLQKAGRLCLASGFQSARLAEKPFQATKRKARPMCREKLERRISRRPLAFFTATFAAAANANPHQVCDATKTGEENQDV